MKRSTVAGILVLAGLLAGCEDQLPTSSDPGLVPVEARSVEVRLPYEAFGTDFRLLSGYGAAVQLNEGILAREFRGSLNARTLSRFQAYPRAATVRDQSGATVSDSSLTFVGGWVTATLDTVSAPDGPVDIHAGALQSEWHAPTVSWDLAVDTVEHAEAWSEPGAGPVASLDSTTWDPAESDTAIFRVDSATVAAWADTSDASRGVRLTLRTEGQRVRVRSMDLRLRARPSVNPDTIVVVSAGPRDLTFIHDPHPDPPPDGMRVGGVPAWRSLFRIAMPETLDGPPELCEELGCPFELDAGAVSFASLVVTTRGSPPAFQPDDTLALDIRPVLRPALLPKSPLGASLVGSVGRELPPSYFTGDDDREINVPVTRYIRDVISDANSGGALDVPSTVALLSTLEPVSLFFASFHGPGSPGAPYLRLILTRDSGVELP